MVKSMKGHLFEWNILEIETNIKHKNAILTDHLELTNSPHQTFELIQKSADNHVAE